MLIFVISIFCCFSQAYATHLSFNDELIDAVDAGDFTAVELMLEANHPINNRGLFGTTALMRAVYRGHLGIVKYLLERGADPDMQDIGGATALHFAARKGNPAMVKILIEYSTFGEVPDLEGYTPSMRALLHNKPKTLEVLLNHTTNPKLTNDKGEDIISLGQHSQHKKIKQLVKSKFGSMSHIISKSSSSISPKPVNQVHPDQKKSFLANIFDKLFNSNHVTHQQPSLSTDERFIINEVISSSSPITLPIPYHIGQDDKGKENEMDLSFENNLRTKSSNIIKSKKIKKRKRKLGVSEAIIVPKSQHIIPQSQK